MANELIGLDAFVVQQLSGDPTLSGLVGSRVYAEVAPQVDPATQVAPVYPLIVFSIPSSVDTNAYDQRAIVRATLRVLTIGEGGGYADIAPVDARVQALLQHPPVTPVVVGGVTYNILGGFRTNAYQYMQIENGVRYNYLGGDFYYLLSAV